MIDVRWLTVSKGVSLAINISISITVGNSTIGTRTNEVFRRCWIDTTSPLPESIRSSSQQLSCSFGIVVLQPVSRDAEGVLVTGLRATSPRDQPFILAALLSP